MEQPTITAASITAPTITSAFVDKIMAIEYSSLPPAAIEVARHVVLNGIAVILAGRAEPLGLGRITIEYVRAMGGAPQATVITGGFKTSMQEAAYANGTLAHALDFDGSGFPLHHPTAPTLPAIFAIAEHHRLPGTKIIEAIVASFEVQARVRLAGTGLKTGAGFHKPGSTGMFGAAAAAAKMLDLNPQQALMAFGIAGSRAGSLALNSGTMTKSSHAGHSARMGVECGVLAKMGWTASADVFGPKGFFDTFMPGNSKPELLTEGLCDPLWVVEPGVGFKLHPCNYFTHRPIDAALALRDEYGIRAEHIDRVQVTFAPFDYVNRPQPRSGLDGKFSVQYTTLVALLDGVVSTQSFTNERLNAPDMAALLPKVKFHADPDITTDQQKMHVIVDVWLKDGRQVTKRVDKLSGYPGSPLTREQMLRKYFSCARDTLNDSSANRVLELVERLDALPDVVEMMDILRMET